MILFVPDKLKPLGKDVLPYSISIYIDFTQEYHAHLLHRDHSETVHFSNKLRKFQYVTESFIKHSCGVTADFETQDFAVAFRRSLQLRKKILRAILRCSKQKKEVEG